MKEKKYRKIGVKAGVLSSIVFSIFVMFLLISLHAGDGIVVREIYQKTLKPVPLGDASLVDGATRVMYVMHYPHQSSPGTAYASNLSNDSAAGGAYEFYDYLDNEMTNETPFSTAFDVVIKMAINVTHGYNTTSSEWELTLHNATLRGITGYNFTSDVAMNEIAIGNSSTWNYVHYYMQDADGGGGNGFQIGQGVSTNATYEFWCYQ